MLLSASLQLTLPKSSKALPGPDGEQFKSSRRWFDFSSAVVPLPEFEDFANDSSICPPSAVYRGKDAYRLTGAYRDFGNREPEALEPGRRGKTQPSLKACLTRLACPEMLEPAFLSWIDIDEIAHHPLCCSSKVPLAVVIEKEMVEHVGYDAHEVNGKACGTGA